MPTVKDVARLAGVSPSTVSIVVNGKQNERKISKETEEKVQSAIKQLNYHPNVAAKNLRNNRNGEYVIGIYWASDFRTNFLSRITAGFQEAILQHHYPVNIVICPYKSGKLHTEQRLQNNDFYHAVIIANTSPADMDFLEKSTPKIPTILFNRYLENYNTVIIDNYKAGKKAALALLEKAPSYLSAILLKNPYLAMGQRAQGFFDTCKDHNIEFPVSSSLYVEENSLDSGVAAANQLLHQEHLPDAIFCDSDILARGMLHVFQEQHIRIPEDIRIVAIGMGLLDDSKYSSPPLSIVNIPMEKIAFRSLEIAMDILQKNVEQPCHVVFDSEFIKRSSS